MVVRLNPVTREGTSTGIHGGNYADGARDYIAPVGGATDKGLLFTQANGGNSTLDQVLSGQVKDPNIGVKTLQDALSGGQIDQGQYDQYSSQLYPDLSSNLRNILTIVQAISPLLPGLGPSIGGDLGALFGSGGGAALATPLGVGASAAIPVVTAPAVTSLAPSLVNDILVHGAGGGLGGALAQGAGAVGSAIGSSALAGSAGGGPQSTQDEGITVTGATPSSGIPSPPGILGIDQVSHVAPDNFQMRDQIGQGETPNDPGKLNGNLIKQILNSGGRGGRVGNSWGGQTPSGIATPAAGPVVGGATPFGGGGAGAGAPGGLAIKGSTAPNIFPWSTGEKPGV